MGELMKQIYEIYVKDHFSAAHALRGYDGNCARMHGHNWIIEAYIQCTKLNQLGIAIDFRDVRSTLKTILEKFDHTDLNQLDEFESVNATSENLAKFIYKELETHFKTEHSNVSKVKVLESPGCGSTYWEE